MKTIVLRHDFDWDSGLTDGVRLMLDIERAHNVRSTIFLRYDRGVSDLKYKDFYQQLEKEGWEFGLHLANHENKVGYDLPADELSRVRQLGLKIDGVAACGGTYNWLDSNGWIVQDGLGLKYICPSSLPIPQGYKMKTALAPTHLTLDGGYLWKDGGAGYPQCIKDFTSTIEKNGVLALLAHNTWFYCDIVPKNFLDQRVRNTKYYEMFIQHFQNLPDYEFKTYRQYLNLDNKKGYDDFYADGGFKYKEDWGNKFISEIKIPEIPNIENLTLLDFGCGDGFWSKILYKYCKNITGIDISKKGIEIAQQKLPACRFLVLSGLEYQGKHEIVFCRAASTLNHAITSETFTSNLKHTIGLASQYFYYIEYSRKDLYNTYDGRWHHKNPADVKKILTQYGNVTDLSTPDYMVFQVKINS